jgi:hypothetical protein
MKYIMALVMCLVAISISAQELPFDLKIGVSMYDAEVKVAAVQGIPTERKSNRTAWVKKEKIIQDKSALNFMSKSDLIVLGSEDNKLSMYRSVSIISQVSTSPCDEALALGLDILKDKMLSVINSKTWVIELKKDYGIAAHHIKNINLKRVVLMEVDGKNKNGTKEITIGISETYSMIYPK